MPQISIVIPAYNAAQTITETIESVQQQTVDDWELIVVNDGSTDNTLEVLQQIVELRLKIISAPNGGVSAARNLGMAQARGQYIAFLDADDLWVADKLELQLEALEQNPNAIVAYSWTCFMDEQQDGYVYHPSPPYQYAGDVYPQLLQRDFIHSGSNTLVRKSALDRVGGFDSRCDICEDWDMWVRLAAIGGFVVVPQHQIMYRRAAGSSTSSVERMYEQTSYAIDKAFQAAPDHLQYIRRQTEANLHMYIASLYLQHGIESAKVQKAAQHIRWSLQKYPLVLRQGYVQKLMIKFALRSLLPGQLGRNIFERLRTMLAIEKPQIMNSDR
ncbi:MAG: glycosyltransferase family A protein [Cyanobacteria bacterium P01_G01_bin.19]